MVKWRQIEYEYWGHWQRFVAKRECPDCHCLDCDGIKYGERWERWYVFWHKWVCECFAI